MKAYLRWVLGPVGGMHMLTLVAVVQLGFTLLSS